MNQRDSKNYYNLMMLNYRVGQKDIKINHNKQKQWHNNYLKLNNRISIRNNLFLNMIS